MFPRTKKSEAHGIVVVERTRTANSYKTRYMHARLCYHFKCISLLIMMEWLDSHVNSAIDMCFRDYCVFWKGNVHVMRRQNHAAMFKIIAQQKKVSELQ